MTENKEALPPLPETRTLGWSSDDYNHRIDGYDEDDMREYAQAAISKLALQALAADGQAMEARAQLQRARELLEVWVDQTPDLAVEPKEWAARLAIRMKDTRAFLADTKEPE